MTNALNPTKVIDADTARRMTLNEQTNPRQTILGEATQTLNPLDGKPYADDTSLLENLEPSLFSMPFEVKHQKKKLYEIPYSIEEKNLYEITNNNTFIESLIAANKPKTTPFLDYQFALARMDVRDGKMAQGEYGYHLNINKKKKLIQKLNEANIPLTTISDANGLDIALTAIENEDSRISKKSFRWAEMGLDCLEEKIITPIEYYKKNYKIFHKKNFEEYSLGPTNN